MPTVTVTVLAALWVGSVRCRVAGSPGPGCDNGKLSLHRDLPADAVSWDCPGSTWPKSSQRRPSVDTVYDPVPARQICMDESISYNHTIPNSGAYRPVRAKSGEYLYCPPHRWLNNLHHGATVLLYHPCAPLRERLLLSVLARSCLPDHVVTSHPHLSEHRPVAFVSWGHTLELSSAAAADVYGWLETTASTRRAEVVGVSRSGKYNLLLTRSAEQHRQQHAHPEERAAEMKESLRQCFERTVSSQLTAAMEAEPESNVKRESSRRMKERGQRRRIRAAVKGEEGNQREDTITHRSNRTTNISGTRDIQNHNFTLGPPTDPPEILNSNQGLTPRSTTPSRTHMSRTTLTSDIINPLADGVNGEGNQTAGHEDEDEANVFSEDHPAGGGRRGDEAVDVKGRELETEPTHGDTHADGNGFHSVSKPRSESRRHQNPQPAGRPPDCDGCSAGGGCECDEDSGASGAVSKKGLPGTPRTDEAAWAAAAALGFLLILLTLSVLHTRLYRHWRTAPSLYWRDTRQNYDSVADVIRRRIRIANTRRKRGRRRECVLLPSSSSSDESP
ncbi:uncharacterized protein tp53i13 isoform X2 [Pseudoliparis swirei]|uniref:uncharacterized protein tp53i13 isoform X2 n=1 Tax=Pseudoliparis swirei TaxID=2059687 RepID=UPI0024BE117A|nr:uncharacterized protein tp53i13 isoform X2 [Pseudoliparis swirei]